MRLLSVVPVVIALAAAGCGSSNNSKTAGTAASAKAAATAASTSAAPASPAKAATARFALHAGLAFGAFHRYVYAPAKAGQLKNLTSHKAVVAKGAAAAFLIGHELKLATAAAKASPALSTLYTQLAVLSQGFSAALARLKAGHFNPVEIETAEAAIEGIKRAAAAAGSPVSERVPSIP
jgi:hypothetical protein